jgi:hypothetical protein
VSGPISAASSPGSSRARVWTSTSARVRGSGPGASGRARPPPRQVGPVHPEARPMPSDHGLGLHDRERALPA